MINQWLIGFYTENGATFITNSMKKEEQIFVWTWNKESKKLKNFQTITRDDEPQPTVQSEQAEPEQCQ